MPSFTRMRFSERRCTPSRERRREAEGPFNQVAPTVPGLAEATNGFQPTQRLRNPLSLDHTEALLKVPTQSSRFLDVGRILFARITSS